MSIALRLYAGNRYVSGAARNDVDTRFEEA